ncbi:hypothetical protein RA086_05800 [Lactiplantibacillus sp. WILCCON 0030]|uniref:Lipoprotein n=1 Tax=Lactiplantibacillus brownii TaxID=3069269 RepID=A0ABU1A875_9LACO|nr:hypothetical protein [Lactiplantibacillus brownii]MDQ7937139.1 hypothetical protein [Lactiplantibacillus brownii]
MRKRFLILAMLGLAGLLGGCAAQAAPTITPKKANEIAAANRQSTSAAQAKAKDASAEKKTGQQYQATNDHITGAPEAASAVEQVLNDSKDESFKAVPNVNIDAHGHHYYQVDAFTKTTTQTRGSLRQSYFVYLDGSITTRQVD